MPGAWQEAIDGIKASLRNGLRVQFNTTVTQENFYDIGNILALGEELRVKMTQLFFLVPTGRGTEVEDVSPAIYEKMIRQVL